MLIVFFLVSADTPGHGSNMSQPDRNLKRSGIHSTTDETFWLDKPLDASINPLRSSDAVANP
jgi:hypothetical protein